MKIAIVNDLEIAQEILKGIVSELSYCEIAWTAYDGQEAIDKSDQSPVDIILMDLIMPNVDGVEATAQIIQDNPNCAILVVTASVETNNDKVYEAMGFGALDAVCTPTGQGDALSSGSADLISKIKKIATISNIDIDDAAAPLALNNSTASPFSGHFKKVLAIGSSTGGPQALFDLLSLLPKNFSQPILIAQHVDPNFAPGLANWLDKSISLSVHVATDGMRPEPSNVYIGSSKDHLILRKNGTLGYSSQPKDLAYRPSANVLFNSLIQAKVEPSCAVLLTGMGNDGAHGLLKLRELGWHTYAQSKDSCVVYGMPKAAVDIGAAKSVLDPKSIAKSILQSV